jgi:hypothetical protein
MLRTLFSIDMYMTHGVRLTSLWPTVDILSFCPTKAPVLQLSIHVQVIIVACLQPDSDTSWVVRFSQQCHWSLLASVIACSSPRLRQRNGGWRENTTLSQNVRTDYAVIHVHISNSRDLKWQLASCWHLLHIAWQFGTVWVQRHEGH